MKVFLSVLGIVCCGAFAHAETLDAEYHGRIVTAPKEVSVRFPDGHVESFDVSDAFRGRISNDDIAKSAEIILHRQDTDKRVLCMKPIGELAADFSFRLKTDENELASLSIKASTPTRSVRVYGDCDDKIARSFTLIDDVHQPLDLQTAMNTEPPEDPWPESTYAGSVTKASSEIVVRAEDGSKQTLSFKDMKFGALYNGRTVTVWGAPLLSKCEPAGQLAKDFFVTVRTAKGMVRTAIIHAAAAGAADFNQVRIYKGCEGGGYQLAMNVPALFEIR